MVGHVLTATQAGIPAMVVAGQVAAESMAPTISLSELAGSPTAAITDPVYWLRTAGSVAAQRY